MPFYKIIQKFATEGILVYNRTYYSLAPKFEIDRTSSVAHKTIEMIKENILSSFESLVKNAGIISFKSGEQFAEYGKFRWAFKGVSNITGLIQNGKSGFLLADIIIGTPIYENDVLFFLEKLGHIQSYKNAPRIMPLTVKVLILVVKSLTTSLDMKWIFLQFTVTKL